MSHRPAQVASLIKEELGGIISKEIEFPDLLVTLTDVRVDKKLDKAIVSFSVLSLCGGCPMAGGCSEFDQAEYFETALKILQKNCRHLQHLLAKKINIKPMPQIEFRIDRGLERAAEVEKLLLKDKMKED